MERPDSFSHEKKDCTVRALSLAANIPYEKSHSILKEYFTTKRYYFTFRHKKLDYFLINQ